MDMGMGADAGDKQTLGRPVALGKLVSRQSGLGELERWLSR